MSIEILLVSLLLLVLVLVIHLLRRLERVHDKLDNKIEEERINLFSQLEAYNSLRDRLDLRRGLPYTKSWSAAPDFYS
ncbi:hypothetical protein [Candidatus Reidiella endopervernicosa]|uniref:hypothetical protein n=1 Tax=Candidatus Reidiella endopervernicosa TaxID=2738883 RepID=UPI001F35624B|nr:hypothetical protein [Candidatus Reidiella endopervernicosa]